LGSKALVIAREIKERNVEAYILGTLGYSYFVLSDYQKAVEYAKLSLAIAPKDPNVATINSLTLGNAYNIFGNPQKAVELLEPALFIAQKTKDRKIESSILITLGAAYGILGNIPKAVNSFEQGLVIARETKQRELEGLALAQLGLIDVLQEKYQKAVEYAQASLRIAKEVKNNEIQAIAVATLSFAYASQPYTLGDPQKAVEFAKLALTLTQQSKQPYLKAMAVNILSMSYAAVNDSQKSIEFANQALKIGQEIKVTLLQEWSMNLLAANYLELGDYQQAIKLLTQNLQISQQSKNRVLQAADSLLLSLAYIGIGDKQKALSSAQTGLNLAREIKDSRLERLALRNLSQVYSVLGNYEKAIESSQASLAIAKKVQSRDGERDALIDLGNLYTKIGKTTPAINAYKQSLAITTKTEVAGDQFKAQAGLARIYRNMNNPQSAIKYYAQAINDIEKQRVNIQGLSPRLQESFLQNLQDRANNVKTVDIYREYADLLLKQNQVAQAQQVLDLLKLQELKAYGSSVQTNTQPQTQTQVGINAILDKAVALGKELDTLEDIKPVNKRTQSQQQRIQELRKIQGQVNKEFADFLKSPEVEKLVSKLQQTTGGEGLNPNYLNNLQDNLKRLQQDAVLLYPLVLKDRLELVVATPYGPPIRRTVAVTEKELNSTIAQFRKDLQTPSSDAKITAQKLYQWLIKPIEKDLAQAKTKTIIYAPDGQLRYIPLAALHDGNQWLVQRFRINNITALSLTDFNTKPQPQIQILAAAFADTKRSVTVKLGEQRYTFQGLEFAGREVEGIASTIRNTKKVLNEQFNPGIIYSMNDYSIVHLATHAAFVVGQPEDSLIMFGDGTYVTLRDVQNWNLSQVDLMVLSACETGLGKKLGDLGDGKEILGFGYQIQRTGARSAIASLWVVDDGGTQALMDNFYTILPKRNTTKAEALRQAQIALITGSKKALEKQQSTSAAGNDFSHPYYWAPFILIGNGL
jgi:CHAT domain-containing protein